MSAPLTPAPDLRREETEALRDATTLHMLPTMTLVASIHDLAREALHLLDEVERLHTWAGLMSLLDEHWPADIFVGGDDADPGPRIVALVRALEQARRIAVTLEQENAEQERVIAGHEADTARAVDAALEGAAREVERQKLNDPGVNTVLDFAVATVRGTKGGAR